MANIEEMKIENVSTEEIRIENRVQLTKVYVGGGEDFIVVSGNDISIVDRFIAAGNKIISLANEMDKKIGAESGQEQEDNFASISESIKIRKEFSEKATQEMDNVFGAGATRKFFGDVYAVIPEFMPDVECFMDFFDSLIPVVERMSEHKVKLEKLASQKRMSKYQPQDHKRSDNR